MKQLSFKGMAISDFLFEFAEDAKKGLSIAIPYGSHIIYKLAQTLIALEMLRG